MLLLLGLAIATPCKAPIHVDVDLHNVLNDLTLSALIVPYGTRCNYMLNIRSICVKFAQLKDFGKICTWKA